MRTDEQRFMVDVYRRCKGAHNDIDVHCTPRDIINEPNFYMHHKRAWYLLEKWDGKGLYDYGISLDLGWLTEKGIEAAENLIKEGGIGVEHDVNYTEVCKAAHERGDYKAAAEAIAERNEKIQKLQSVTEYGNLPSESRTDASKTDWKYLNWLHDDKPIGFGSLKD